MRKATKQKIAVLMIIFLFGMSSIAYIITGLFGTREDVQKPKTLDSFVVDSELDSITESDYYRKGFTIMKFYYSENSLIDYVGQMPEMTRAPNGAYQLIVEKIPADSTYVKLSGPNGDEEIKNVSSQAIQDSLCSMLYYPPIECALLNMQKNATA